ncbi:MAG: CHAT domain-containing protein [Chloroflexus sp.]|uniref:CHAT domain-containing protein n=1 Tax=Chloroflexus sp. TaxID=1904827 RepID=UPI00404AB866
MRSTYQPVLLSIDFSSYQRGFFVRWESSEVIDITQSQMPMPIAEADVPLVLRALDVLQDPVYPHPWTSAQEVAFAFSQAEQDRLRELNFWDEDNRAPVDLPRRVGRRLFRALTHDKRGAEVLKIVRAYALAVDRPLLISCHFHAHAPADVTLAALPWELLWADEPTPLLTERRLAATIERRLKHTGPPPALTPGRGALRILALSPQAGIPMELRQIERSARMHALQPLLERNLAEVRELSPVSRRELERVVREWSPDVIHYYGHGRYEQGSGALLLDRERGGEEWTPPDALAAAFGGVQMVVLHACQGAMATPGVTLLSSVAPALSLAGVPVVIGMQFTIRADAATRIAGIVYAGLAQGRSVQEALAAARIALYVGETDQVSWFVPALYVRSRSHGPIYLRPPTDQPPVLTLGVSSSSQPRHPPRIRRLRIQEEWARQRLQADRS